MARPPCHSLGISQVLAGEGKPLAAYLRPDEEKAHHEGDHVHEPVVADLKWPNTNEDRVHPLCLLYGIIWHPANLGPQKPCDFLGEAIMA